MRQAGEKLRKAPALEAVFTATHSGQSVSGEILLSGNRFKLVTPALTTWYDGKTQWAYSPAAMEVNVSEPTSDELSQINPFEILNAMQKSFSPRRLASSNNEDKIELTPKQKGEYSRIVISFNSATLYPTQIVFTGTDKSVTIISLSSVKAVKAVPADTFRFNPRLYPGVEIIDLR
ncbi:MAG: outer membrane lipoprotein carrier protein LolA [Muribaculaceae bacterium]|nr:outer membrane lipoprotein carrier protein LolA [Muribaculaceae bacterium]